MLSVCFIQFDSALYFSLYSAVDRNSEVLSAFWEYIFALLLMIRSELKLSFIVLSYSFVVI